MTEYIDHFIDSIGTESFTASKARDIAQKSYSMIVSEFGLVIEKIRLSATEGRFHCEWRSSDNIADCEPIVKALQLLGYKIEGSSFPFYVISW